MGEASGKPLRIGAIDVNPADSGYGRAITTFNDSTACGRGVGWASSRAPGRRHVAAMRRAWQRLHLRRLAFFPAGAPAGTQRAARALPGPGLTAGESPRVVLLLSDCLPTAGGDPALALTGISRLHVFCPLPTAESERAATALARRGRGVSQPLRTLADVAPALTRVLG